MIEISHTYSLNDSWQKEVAGQLIKIGAVKINEKLLQMPKDIADGGFYFTEVISGVSVVVLDMTFKKDVIIKRIKSSQNIYIYNSL